MDPFVLNGAYYSLPYDVLNDFAPISPLTTLPTVLAARRTMPANDLRELIVWLKAHDNQAAVGMNTLGFRLLAALFQNQTRTQFTVVPYRSAGTQMQDLIAGRIDYQCPDTPIAIPQIHSKMVKAIAILTRERSPGLPDQATAHEQGVTDFDASNWFGAFFPKGTSAAVVDKLHAAILATINTAAVKARMQEIGADLVTRERSSPDYLQRFVEAEIQKWAGPIKASGISMD